MSYWDKAKFIAEIPVSEHSRYTVELCEKENEEFVNIRGWYNTKKDPEWKPGKNGMTVKLDIFQQIIEKWVERYAK